MNKIISLNPRDDPFRTKNLTVVDVNWFTQPYLTQNPSEDLFARIVLYILYTVYIRVWYVHRKVLSIPEIQATCPIFRFLTILNYLNLGNVISSLLMIIARFRTNCEGIYKFMEIIEIVCTSIASDCTIRTTIWFLIVVTILGCVGKLKRSLITLSAVIIFIVFTTWSIIIRTVVIRYTTSGRILGNSCIKKCCAQGEIQYIPEDLMPVFNVFKVTNDYINLVSVILLTALIPVLMTALVISIRKLERVRDIAIWTPILTALCQILQILSVYAIFPNYRVEMERGCIAAKISSFCN
ncbi:hypothetical protein CAEBREN_22060 [Caenorhabditis brenneri]|uniref:Uncharacterized protein n=1 Tax=Caenorhabditis brenneri TaxID=135651 RepID=G0NEL6_CAEBE|nr:hypothetical protein CAEBREN_22060 [Caenorhabditis brenneri]